MTYSHVDNTASLETGNDEGDLEKAWEIQGTWSGRFVL